MTKPIIGITANQRLNIALDDIPWSYAPTGFVHAVSQAGGLPLLLPIGDQETAKTYVSMVDKIILIGGQNVDPSYYGEEKAAAEDDFLLERDVYEIAIIKEALRQQKPIFAVCRGMQLVNVVLGGSLHQDIASHWQSLPSAQFSHEIEIKDGSVLASIYGQKSPINSFHRQAIKDLATGLTVVAHSAEDGIIEAVEAPQLRYLGVQWHPELLQETSQADRALFDYVVNQL